MENSFNYIKVSLCIEGFIQTTIKYLKGLADEVLLLISTQNN